MECTYFWRAHHEICQESVFRSPLKGFVAVLLRREYLHAMVYR